VASVTDIVNEHPELRLTLQVGQMLGYELLLRECLLEGSDLPDAERHLAVFAVPCEIEVTEDELNKFCDVIGNSLLDIGREQPEIGSRIDTLSDLSERERTAKGLISDIAQVTTSIGWSIAALLIIAKLRGRYELKTGDGFVELQGGIPAGFKDIVSVIRSVVESIIKRASSKKEELNSDMRCGDEL
jgi:hypothetical protein